MSNVDDLLEPLRYNNLSNFLLTDVRSIGGGVFVEEGSLDHLRILDLVVKGYQSVHIPTFGHPIPGTSEIHGASITSATSKAVITPDIGEVLKIQALQFTSTEDNTSVKIKIHDTIQNTSVLYFTSANLPNGTAVTLFGDGDYAISNIGLEIPYGQSLYVEAVSSGAVALQIMAITVKTQQ